ncbi:uncharacterized protein PAC_15388 [Phialocephala subalpina]|uniref:Uncharacterized protein n=1 Tax=Phialocephala subalpina TaxID=576137 RepID=A0A1L7XKE4_9HELO|nr:uncharacterized protein PAC_15388 [Phialocephala subalpina]
MATAIFDVLAANKIARGVPLGPTRATTTTLELNAAFLELISEEPVVEAKVLLEEWAIYCIGSRWGGSTLNPEDHLVVLSTLVFFFSSGLREIIIIQENLMKDSVDDKGCNMTVDQVMRVVPQMRDKMRKTLAEAALGRRLTDEEELVLLMDNTFPYALKDFSPWSYLHCVKLSTPSRILPQPLDLPHARVLALRAHFMANETCAGRIAADGVPLVHFVGGSWVATGAAFHHGAAHCIKVFDVRLAYKMMSALDCHFHLNPITEEHLNIAPDRDYVNDYGRRYDYLVLREAKNTKYGFNVEAFMELHRRATAYCLKHDGKRRETWDTIFPSPAHERENMRLLEGYDAKWKIGKVDWYTTRL